jgi:hypothetical protein
MSRWKASALHLCISALVITTLGALLSLTWYPPAYARGMGGLGLIAILAGVDLTLGPLLTLIIWNVQKKSLKYDMAVIVVLQLIGLSYGIYAISQARPVYMVFAYDRFDLVTVADIPEGETAKAQREEFKSLPLTGPKTIAAQRPNEREERNKLLFSSVFGGADLAQTPRYYVPYAEMAPEIAKKAKPLSVIMQRNTEARDTLTRYLEEHRLNQDQVKFLPLRAHKLDQTVLVDADNGQVIEIINLDPW